jgi:hypothetical protein
LEIVTVGAWLSTRTLVTSADAFTLPAQSVAVARMSYRPSATASGPVFVFHVAGTIVQAVVACGATSKTTAGLGSASVTEALRLTVSVTLEAAAGLVTEIAGCVLSIRMFAIGGVEVATFPAKSLTTTWKS